MDGVTTQLCHNTKKERLCAQQSPTVLHSRQTVVMCGVMCGDVVSRMMMMMEDIASNLTMVTRNMVKTNYGDA